jgi:hypothetical protein
MENIYTVTTKKEEYSGILKRFEDYQNQSNILFDAKNGDEILMNGKTTLTYENGVNGEKAKIVVSVKIEHAPLPYKKAK